MRKIESVEIRYEPELRSSAKLVLESGEVVSVVTHEPHDHALISRLVACWNTCAGISTVNIESGLLRGITMLKRLDELKRVESIEIESVNVINGLLNALPSATTHPAITAARQFIAKHGGE